MALKEKAVPLPDLRGKSVIDIGCDHGWWCKNAILAGASSILGLDRGRLVGDSFVDLALRNKESIPGRFEKLDIGRQWHNFGKFDVALCLSMYHHVFENCGSHSAIWYWLWQHTREELLWENPTSTDDDVVRLNVSRDGYNRTAIMDAALRYFHVEVIGPALHVRTREVWRCKPREMPAIKWQGRVTHGGGGATKAFNFADGRRIKEIESILGARMVPGSLNLKLAHPFGWEHDYYRAQVLDCTDRANINSEWMPRWARFYPVKMNAVSAFAFKFEGESYPLDYVELIAPEMLSEHVTGDIVTLTA